MALDGHKFLDHPALSSFWNFQQVPYLASVAKSTTMAVDRDQVSSQDINITVLQI